MPRNCGNCYFNPTGQICQLEPMVVTETRTTKITQGALVGQTKQEPTVERNSVPRFTPTGYCCSKHTFAREAVEMAWSWDDEA